jgi:hypothetical protein
MSRFKIGDLSTLEKSPTSPLTLRNKIGEMLFNSTQAVATVEIVNKDTGEYRVVLQGTLDTEESLFAER